MADACPKSHGPPWEPVHLSKEIHLVLGKRSCDQRKGQVLQALSVLEINQYRTRMDENHSRAFAPAGSRKRWAVNGFRFLDLPFELRELVLCFAIGPFTTRFAQIQNSDKRPRISILNKPNMSLALVSKQLHREFTQTLCAHTTFRLLNVAKTKQFYFNQAVPSEKNLPPLSQWIRYLDLHMDAHNLLLCFGLDMIHPHGERLYRYVRSNHLGHSFSLTLTAQHSLRRIRIRVPHVMQYFLRKALPTICQSVFCQAFWAGAKEFLRHVSVVEITGHVNKDKKTEWIKELALERNGIVPDPDDLFEWQDEILRQWYIPIC